MCDSFTAIASHLGEQRIPLSLNARLESTCLLLSRLGSRRRRALVRASNRLDKLSDRNVYSIQKLGDPVRFEIGLKL